MSPRGGKCLSAALSYLQEHTFDDVSTVDRLVVCLLVAAAHALLKCVNAEGGVDELDTTRTHLLCEKKVSDPTSDNSFSSVRSDHHHQCCMGDNVDGGEMRFVKNHAIG